MEHLTIGVGRSASDAAAVTARSMVVHPTCAAGLVRSQLEHTDEFAEHATCQAPEGAAS